MQYRFANCELDTQLYTLHRLGRSTQLQPQVFQFLIYLLEHRDRVVTKTELIEQVWPEQYVSDVAFASCLRKVRQAVGDDGKTQQVIQTSRGHGYRLIATVAVDPQTAGTADACSEDEGLRPVVHTAAERKVVTFLCCAPTVPPLDSDVQRLDTVYAHLQVLYDLSHPVIAHYGGQVQMVAGERMVAVFGAPLAHEDHAQRAAYAALDIQQAISACSGEAPGMGEGLSPVRLVLHTGHVVVGGVGATQTAAISLVGAAETLAATLLEYADSGSLICSEPTALCLQHDIGLTLVPVQELPGDVPHHRVYQIRRTAPQPIPNLPFQLSRSQPFVGRERELSILQGLWAQAESGRGQLVGIVGAPGIGKSRLLDVFRQRLVNQPYRYMQGQCRSYGMSTPYLPIHDLLSQCVDISKDDGGDAMAAKVSRFVEEAGMDAETEAPYLQHVLGMPIPPSRSAGLPPELIKARTFEVLVQLILRASQRGAVVLVVEDIHWIDATSQAWLEALASRLRGAPVLLLATYRPGYTPPWIAMSYATQLPLAPLAHRESQALVQMLLAVSPLAVQPQHLVDKAEGNPFFLVELVRAMKDQPHSEAIGDVPVTIQAMLMSRIDRLTPEAKMVLQASAVMGPEVPYDFLATLTALPKETLDTCLVELRTAEFMMETHPSEAPVYVFSHVLIQDVAYQSLLKPARQQLHRLMAQRLTDEPTSSLRAHPEWIAHHYTEAGYDVQAVRYWQQAGQQALHRAAYAESAAHFSKALQLMTSLPDPSELQPLELDVQIDLGQALMASHGYTAPAAGKAYEQAWELCRQVGDARQQFATLCGLRRFYDNRGDLLQARRVGEQLDDLAKQFEDPTYQQEAHYSLAHTLYFQGDFTTAYQHLESGIALVDPEHPDSVRLGLLSRDIAAHCCWLLGYPSQSQSHVKVALEVAQQQSNPMHVVHALYYAAGISRCLQDAKAVQALADQLIAVAAQWQLSYWHSWGTLLQSWALSQQESPEAALEALQAYWTQSNIDGANVLHLAAPTLLAETYGYLGQFADALDILAKGLTSMQQSGKHVRLAELYRLRGEFLLQTGDDLRYQEDAESCFHQALTIAQRQLAKSLELRAAISLAELWQAQGKRREAYGLLIPIHQWFTEGYDTADLRQAQALLSGLKR